MLLDAIRPAARNVSGLLQKLRRVAADTAEFGWETQRAILRLALHRDRVVTAFEHGAASAALSRHVETLERTLALVGSRAAAVHSAIGQSIFNRSPELYNGRDLPECLRRYTYPPVLSIALSSHCNAACFFCRESDYRGTSVNFEQIKTLETPIRFARTIDLTGWGEPFLYPRFSEVLEYIFSLNQRPDLIQVTTNGSLLSARFGKLMSGHLAKMYVSLNASDPATYEAVMRYKTERVTLDDTVHRIREFMSQLTSADRRVIVLHMVATSDNYREMASFVDIAASLKIRFVNIGHFICANERYLPKTLLGVRQEYNSELDRAFERGAKLGLTVFGRRFFSNEKTIKGADHCVAPFEQCFVEMEGTVAPCCYMGRERMGNVYRDGFERVWFGQYFTQLRHARSLPPCKVCTIFTPFDDPVAHMSAFLTTRDAAVVTAEGG